MRKNPNFNVAVRAFDGMYVTWHRFDRSVKDTGMQWEILGVSHTHHGAVSHIREYIKREKRVMSQLR